MKYPEADPFVVNLVMFKPQHEWTAEEKARVAAEQARILALFPSLSKKEGEK